MLWDAIVIEGKMKNRCVRTMALPLSLAIGGHYIAAGWNDPNDPPTDPLPKSIVLTTTTSGGISDTGAAPEIVVDSVLEVEYRVTIDEISSKVTSNSS